MHSKYLIYLDNEEIGWTAFEYEDAPMGVVFGAIHFNEKKYGYNWLKSFCIKKEIILITDYPEDKLLTFSSEEYLKVKNEKGIELKGVGGNEISGMDSDKFDISILGIGYPFYEVTFPHHVKAYKEK